MVFCASGNEAQYKFVVYRDLFIAYGDRPWVCADSIDIDIRGDASGIIV